MLGEQGLLGASWVWAITIVILLITPLITTHEPPSRVRGFEGLGFEPKQNLPGPFLGWTSTLNPKPLRKDRRQTQVKASGNKEPYG